MSPLGYSGNDAVCFNHGRLDCGECGPFTPREVQGTGVVSEHACGHRKRNDECSVCRYKPVIEELQSRITALEKIREAAVGVAYNVAGTEGTKTNSELPRWFALRLKDLQDSLESYATQFPEGRKEND